MGIVIRVVMGFEVLMVLMVVWGLQMVTCSVGTAEIGG